MPSREKLAEFTAWCRKNVTGDEKGQAQIFLDRLFQAFGQPGCLDVGGTTEFRLRKSTEDGGGTAFADQMGDLLPGQQDKTLWNSREEAQNTQKRGEL